MFGNSWCLYIFGIFNEQSVHGLANKSFKDPIISLANGWMRIDTPFVSQITAVINFGIAGRQLWHSEPGWSMPKGRRNKICTHQLHFSKWGCYGSTSESSLHCAQSTWLNTGCKATGRKSHQEIRNRLHYCMAWRADRSTPNREYSHGTWGKSLKLIAWCYYQ